MFNFPRLMAFVALGFDFEESENMFFGRPDLVSFYVYGVSYEKANNC